MPKRGRMSRGPVGLARLSGRQVMRFVPPEKKFYDHGQGFTLATAASAAVTLDTGSTTTGAVGIVQGPGSQQRIGAKIGITNVAVKLRLVSGADNRALYANINQPFEARVLMVLDKQPNGDLAPISDVLTSSGGTSGYFAAHRNLSNTARFRVLYDKVHKLNPQIVAESTSTTPADVFFTAFEDRKLVNINKSFKKPIVRQYTTGSTTSGAPDVTLKNQLLLYIVNGAEDYATGMSVLIYSRLRFVDA